MIGRLRRLQVSLILPPDCFCSSAHLNLLCCCKSFLYVASSRLEAFKVEFREDMSKHQIAILDCIFDILSFYQLSLGASQLVIKSLPLNLPNSAFGVVCA